MTLPQTADEFQHLWTEALAKARAAFELLRQHTSIDAQKFLRDYDMLAALIEQVSAPASLFSNVHPDSAVRSCAELFEQKASKLITEISLDKKLFEICSTLSTEGLDALELRLYERIMRDYRRSGVDKSPEIQARITALHAELVEIGQTFEKTIREDVRAIELRSAEELAGLPADFIAAHKPDEQGVIRVTTDYPDLKPFLAYAENAAARKELFIKFNSRAYPANESVLRTLIEKRHELAGLLGYSSWADYVTEDKMIRTGAAVQEFIDKIDAIARPKGAEDYAVLLEEKRRTEPSADRVEEWEKPYWEERVKKQKFNFDSQEVRPYFEYVRVRDGLLDLTAKLFELEYKKIDAPTWHTSVDAYDVQRAGTTLGRIYLDMHPRDNKYKHAAQFTLQSGVAGQQLPEGVLVCNFSDPSAQGPALMDNDQVTTFFHEFGHLLHHVIGGNQKFAYFSGVATEWDFVEAPSQFFEEWAMDTETLQRFARHIETGEPIPTHLVERMRAADEFGKGLFARRQMVYAALSLNCYRKDPSTFDIHELAVEMQNHYGQFPYETDTHHECSFGHLDGYSAIYYTYMWSLVIAKDLLSKFLTAGMLNTTVSTEYRKTILEPGGSKDAADLIKDFLGRPYAFDAFAGWLKR